jgi:group II intron reverse transcriptase/maturase
MEMVEKILEASNLTRACMEVVKNKGAGGIDRMPSRELKAYLDVNRHKLCDQVRSGYYLPQPIRGKGIPKGNGKQRLLGIPTAIDRMLQQAVLRVVMPLYEPGFCCDSFGFRPNRNAHQAVSKALGYINSGFQNIVEIDLQAFFDEVDHVLLMQLIYRKVKCRETLRLLKRWLRAPIEIEGKLVKRRKGVPQGSPISPFLSNVMLHELDKEMERLGLKFVRYADDFSIYCKTKQDARKANNLVVKFLRENLKLPVNVDKSGIRRPINLQVLGFGFVPTYRKGERGKYQLAVTAKKIKSFKEKLKELTCKTTPMGFDERIEKLNSTIRGWMEYFRYASIRIKLTKLDGWLRNRLRYCIWHHWKKPEKKRRSLIRLGIPHGQAYAWSRTRMGGWAVAQSPILGTIITIKRLKKRGYIPMVELFGSISPNYNNSLFPVI